MKTQTSSIDCLQQSRYEYFNHAFENSKIINPARFVWHVASRENRWSINRKGIIKPHAEYAVFANNIPPVDNFMMLFWPLPIDCFDYNNLSLTEFYSLYDFWRIDTHAFDTEWRIDPVLANELSCYNLESARHYICTRSNIPPQALKLCRYKGEKTRIKYSPYEFASIEQLPVLRAA
jgi:hypothetical protein